MERNLAARALDYFNVDRLLTFAQLRDFGIPYTRMHISRLVVNGEFPAPIKLGSNTPNGRVAWRESELQAWLESRERVTPILKNRERVKLDDNAA